MISPPELLRRLEACPAGVNGWKDFEDICIEILTHLFVPPLAPPKIQPRTHSGIDRRDAVFPNRHPSGGGQWGMLYRELSARLILFEFKNYDNSEIGKEEVNQTRNYMTAPMGRLAILCCNKEPNSKARVKRNTVYSEDGKVILFLTKKNLVEMMAIKERGEDPANLIIDLLEWFYLQHE